MMQTRSELFNATVDLQAWLFLGCAEPGQPKACKIRAPNVRAVHYLIGNAFGSPRRCTCAPCPYGVVLNVLDVVLHVKVPMAYGL